MQNWKVFSRVPKVLGKHLDKSQKTNKFLNHQYKIAISLLMSLTRKASTRETQSSPQV